MPNKFGTIATHGVGVAVTVGVGLDVGVGLGVPVGLGVGVGVGEPLTNGCGYTYGVYPGMVVSLK